MANQCALISHPDCLKHDMGAGHPESPERLRAILERIEDSELQDQLLRIQATPAADAALLAAHPQRHLEHLSNLSPASGLVSVDADTAMCPDSLHAARLAAGALVQAVDGVLADDFQRAFCAVRPPGHHAEYEQAMGFCLFNNIAIAVRHAQREHGLERVAVLDFDVHHCNGTVDIFKDDPSVLICSSFQHPFYPFRYADIQRPNIVNSPLAAGEGGAEFRELVERDWAAALRAHHPELILVSAGFDAHRDDPLADLRFDVGDYRWVGQWIRAQARQFCGDRVVSTLEGGYNLDALANSCTAYLSTML